MFCLQVALVSASKNENEKVQSKRLLETIEAALHSALWCAKQCASTFKVSCLIEACIFSFCVQVALASIGDEKMQSEHALETAEAALRSAQRRAKHYKKEAKV